MNDTPLPQRRSGLRYPVIFALLLMISFHQSVIADSHIAEENRNAGTSGWRLTKPGNDNVSHIKAFTNVMSVDPGDSLKFFVTVNPVQNYSISIYRMGFYQGLGGRLMWQRTRLTGTAQPDCPLDRNTGQITCNWNESLALTIPPDWVTGIYLAKLVNQNGFENHVPFLVRNGARRTALLYQQPVTTYHAYNNYPNDGVRGKSTYTSDSHGGNTLSGESRAVKVSFDRPNSDTGSYRYFLREHELVMFLEERGYDLSYVTNIDVHRNPGYLDGIKGFVSGGHDEYWTSEIRDTLDNAKDAGKHLAFFGANAGFRQIRLEPDTNGNRYRVMAVYKDHRLDPEPVPGKKTVTFRSIGRAEQQLVGVQYITYGRAADRRDFIVKNPDHWIYANTGVSSDDVISNIIGGEVDLLFSNYAQPVSIDYTVIGESPFRGVSPVEVLAQSVVHQAPSGAWVFGSGTLLWHQGLNHPRYKSETLRQMTTNLLDRFVDAPSEDTPTITINAADVVESEGNLFVNFDLSSASTHTVNFKAATQIGTAVQGEDYIGASSTITIAPGNTRVTWPVTIINDEQMESVETLTIRMWNLTGARSNSNDAFGNTYRAVAIVDDDNDNDNDNVDDDQTTMPSLELVDTTVNEADGQALLTIRLSAPATQRVAFNLTTTTGGNAAPRTDYFGVFRILEIAPGQESVTFPITIVNDDNLESTEFFRAQIHSPVNATVARRYAEVTILDDDDQSVLPSLQIADTTVNESDGQAAITIQMSAPATQTVTLHLTTTTGGNAIPRTDYFGVFRILEIAPGQESVTFPITIVDDNNPEPTEFFRVQIHSPVNATVARRYANVTISDND